MRISDRGQRPRLQLLSGSANSSITCFAVVTRIRENGTMCGRTLFELAWQQIGNSGRTLVRYLISNFTTRIFEY